MRSETNTMKMQWKKNLMLSNLFKKIKGKEDRKNFMR